MTDKHSSPGSVEDWSCAADFLDKIEVDVNGMCRWSDVANAQMHIRRALRSVQPRTPAQGKQEPDDWQDDPSADKRWNAGLDFGMVQLCAVLGVDPHMVTWDAATETLDGDVCAAIGNIFRVKYGEDFDPIASSVPSTERSHKVMTAEEYMDMPIIGWHEVCRDVDGFGAIGVRFLGLSTDRGCDV